jgi:1-acyl-sn-glycerol-3-phosphate acyltransferase
MAARRGALAAGAARASGERARRRSTPLIGADPVVPAGEATDDGVTTAKAVSATSAAKGSTAEQPAARKKPAARRKPAGGKATAAKRASTTSTAKTAKPSATVPKATGPGRGARKKSVAQPSSSTPSTAVAEPTTGAGVPASGPVGGDAGTGEATVAALPTTPATRRPHRPAPRVTSAPSRAASRQAGERRTPSKGVAGRRPRTDPREKARRDAARPHLRIAEPPIDPTVHAAPSRTGLPLPDVADALEAAVGLLRLGAEAAGIAPQDVERRVAEVLAYVRRRVDGDYEVDDFGYDADFTEHVFYPMLRPLYRHWFRVEVRGIENIPATGGALVVSNHSGTVAIDSLMVQLALHDEHPSHRVMRALGADLVFQTPFLGTIARRSGSTLATSEDAERLFEQGELVGVFPEGFKGVGKPFHERYKLQRFGRGGFVAAALKAQVPIIPCSVVGAEEIYPILGNMGTIARLLGMPYAPITPTFPLLGPLGLIPLPSKWVIEFGTPIATDQHGEGAADDPMLVFDLTDQVRETIQHTLYTLLMQRRSVFF